MSVRPEKSSGTATPARVAAVLVSYRPKASVFPTVLRSAATQVEELVVVDNSPEPESQEAVARMVEAVRQTGSEAQLTLLTLGENTGLSRGINRGVRKGFEDGCSFFLLLDQDSVLGPAAVRTLREEHGRRAAGRGEAVLAAENDIPNPSPLHRLLDSVYYRYRAKTPEGHPSPLAITSGLFVPAAVFRRVGLFDESLFLDSADHEFCLRARRRGVRLFTVPSARVHHMMGEPTGDRSGLLGAELRYQNEDQLYYGTRDTLRTVRRYWLSHPLLGTSLFGFTVARSMAYRWGGPGYRRQYLAARRGWVDFVTLPDRPEIPPMVPGSSGFEGDSEVGP